MTLALKLIQSTETNFCKTQRISGDTFKRVKQFSRNSFCIHEFKRGNSFTPKWYFAIPRYFTAIIIPSLLIKTEERIISKHSQRKNVLKPIFASISSDQVQDFSIPWMWPLSYSWSIFLSEFLHLCVTTNISLLCDSIVMSFEFGFIIYHESTFQLFRSFIQCSKWLRSPNVVRYFISCLSPSIN